MKKIRMIICFAVFFVTLLSLGRDLKAEDITFNDGGLQENQEINMALNIEKKDKELKYQGYTKKYSLIINKDGLYKFFINFSSDNNDDMFGGIELFKKVSGEKLLYSDYIYYVDGKRKQYAEYVYYLESGEYDIDYILWDFNRDGFGAIRSSFGFKTDTYIKGEVNQIIDNGYIQYRIMENPVINDNKLIKRGKIEIISIQDEYKKISIVNTIGSIELINDDINKSIEIKLSNYDVFNIKKGAFDKTRGKISELRVRLGSYKNGEISEYADTVASDLLKGMKKLESFSIEGVKRIPKGLFRYTKKLNTISIYTERIPKGLFKYSKKVTRINLGAKRIPKGLCKNLNKLNSIWISCNNVPDNICMGCKNLEDIDLVNVRKIGRKAFYGTNNLKTLSINLFDTGVLKNIGKNAFFIKGKRKEKICIYTIDKKNVKRFKALSKKAGLKKDDYFWGK